MMSAIHSFRYGLMLSLAGVAICASAQAPSQQRYIPRPPHATEVRETPSNVDTSAEREIVRLVNHERTSRGLQPLAVDDRLLAAARVHSELMARYGDVGHVVRGEKTVEIRLGETGIHQSRLGENVAMTEDAASAHDALMHSPGHRANILKPEYNAVGIGVVRTRDSIFVTQDFAERTADLSVDEAEHNVADRFNGLRQRARVGTLPVLEAPVLRQGACEMARTDALNPAMFSRKGTHPLEHVQNMVAYTATDILTLPSDLVRLTSEQGSAMSIGICYARSASYNNPVYWVALVVYAKR
jgi:uncharacterized protein YkwD